MATLMDIAAALDLNKTTVSKALNNSSDISRETKERVLAEAERIGYVKHRRKRVQSDQNALIGIICPEIVSYYYAQLVTSLSACLQKKVPSCDSKTRSSFRRERRLTPEGVIRNCSPQRTLTLPPVPLTKPRR